MESEIKHQLCNLSKEIEFFKEKNESKIKNQEQRLERLEKSYDIADQRPVLSKEDHKDTKCKQQLQDYLKKGITSDIEVKSDGFPLRHAVVKDLDTYLLELSPMRKVASVDKISSDYISYVVSKNSVDATWVQKNTTPKPEDIESDATVVNLYTHEICTQPSTTQRMLEDSSVDIEKWIAEQAGIAFLEKENDAFINGDGNFKPIGILSYNKITLEQKIDTIKTQEAGKINPEDLMNLYYSLEERFLNNCAFLMNNGTIQQIRSLKYKQSGQYIWQPSLKDQEPDTLMGVPVIASSKMPVASSGQIAIAFGNFKRGYKIIDRTEIKILRDPYSNKPYVSFYITKRLGGGVLESRALKLLQIQ